MPKKASASTRTAGSRLHERCRQQQDGFGHSILNDEHLAKEGAFYRDRFSDGASLKVLSLEEKSML